MGWVFKGHYKCINNEYIKDDEIHMIDFLTKYKLYAIMWVEQDPNVYSYIGDDRNVYKCTEMNFNNLFKTIQQYREDLIKQLL